MATKSKAPKASKVVYTNPAVNTLWKDLVAKTKVIDASAEAVVIEFAKTITARKIDLRNARKSIEELGIESSVLKSSQIEALPTLLALNAKGKGFKTFKDMDIKTKCTKATAAYKLGVGIAAQMPTWEAVAKEVKTFNKAKNDGKASTPKTSKEPKVKATDADTIGEIMAYISALVITEDISGLLSELECAIVAKIDTYNEALV